jgi:hypothetical protein
MNLNSDRKVIILKGVTCILLYVITVHSSSCRISFISSLYVGLFGLFNGASSTT